MAPQYAQRSGEGGWVQSWLGFRGTRNLLAWAVAGGLAYYWYVKPIRERQDEQKLARDIARQLAEERRLREEAEAAAGGSTEAQ